LATVDSRKEGYEGRKEGKKRVLRKEGKGYEGRKEKGTQEGRKEGKRARWRRWIQGRV
jgi:hypothetical protein